ncbi:hypothetical protein, partial [Ruegeria marina]|uniref:hypothetical protein n=1 Tax=Ruegeria marina TaxID=639004 RepID=UPI001C40AB97
MTEMRLISPFLIDPDKVRVSRLRGQAFPAAAFVVLSTILLPDPALSQSCNNEGQLTFVGRTNDLTRSVWLSQTNSGRYQLQGPSNGDIVDDWLRATPGARLSISPFATSSSGATHRLFQRNGGSDCLVDTQNSKPNGIVLPPLPPGLIRPPVGIVPPIGTIPPTGVTPELPVGVT